MARLLRTAFTIVVTFATVAPHASAEQAVSYAGKSNTADPLPLRWSLLAPGNGKPFTDPFAQLSNEQIEDLSYVVRVARLIADRQVSADGEDAKEAAALASALAQQGIDIGTLLSQRRSVRLELQKLDKPLWIPANCYVQGA